MCIAAVEMCTYASVVIASMQSVYCVVVAVAVVVAQLHCIRAVTSVLLQLCYVDVYRFAVAVQLQSTVGSPSDLSSHRD